MSTQSTVTVAPGQGLLARRRHALIFAPSGDPSGALIESFTAASDSDLADALLGPTGTGERDADDASVPFVFVQWGEEVTLDDIHIVVHGDVTLVSDDATMAPITGSAAAHPVERCVPGGPKPVRFTSGAVAVAQTDVVSGIVAAGGFELSLTPDTTTTDSGEESQTPAATNVPLPAGLAALQTAAGGDWMEESLQLGGGRRTAAPHPTASAGTGHDGNEPPLMLAVMGLPGGERVGVSGDVVLGRRPSADAARAASASMQQIVAPATVSRTHLLVTVEAGHLFAIDCGSLGGTAVLADGDDVLRQLDPWVAHEIGIGDRIYLGGPTCLTIEEATPDDR